MSDLRALKISFGATFEQLDKDLGTLKKKLEGTADNLSSVGRGLTTHVTAPMAIAAGAALKFSTDFNMSMANVSSLIPGNTARVNELKKSVQDMAMETGQSTADLSGGLYQLISAFGDSAESADQLKINAKAAAAGVASVEQAIGLTSAVTKAYGDTSAEAQQRVSDLAFTAVRLGQTTFPELAASIGRVTPLTKELNVSQEELFGTMATFTGVTGQASEVSTQLRGVLQALMNPTEDMGKLFGSLGVESGKALIEQRGLQGAIETVVEAAKGSGKPLQSYIGSIEGQTLALAAAGPQADTFTEKLATMQNAAGATEQAFLEQTQGVNAFGQSMREVRETGRVAFQALGDVIGETLGEVLQPLLDDVKVGTKLFRDRMAELDPTVRRIGVGLAVVAGAIGPVLVGVAAGAKAFVALKEGLILAKAGFTLLTGAIGPVGLAIAGVSAAVVLLITHWEEISAWMERNMPEAISAAKEAWQSIKRTISDVIDSIKAAVMPVLQELAAFWKAWGRTILSIAQTAFRQVLNVVSTVIELVANTITTVLAALRGDWDAVWEGIGNALNIVWDFIKKTVLNGVDIVLAALQKLLGWIPGMEERIQQARDKISQIIDSQKATAGTEELRGHLDTAAKGYEQTAVVAAESATLAAEAWQASGSAAAESISSFKAAAVPTMREAVDDLVEQSERQKRAWAETAAAMRVDLRTIPETYKTEIEEKLKKTEAPATLREAFGTAIGTVQGYFHNLRRDIGEQGLFGTIKSVFTGGGGIMGIFDTVASKGIGGLISSITGGGGGLGGLLGAIGGSGGIAGTITSVLGAAGPWGMALGGALKLAQAFGLDLGAVWDGIKSAASAVFNSIKSIASSVFGSIWKGIKGLLGIKGSSKGSSGTETVHTPEEIAEMEQQREEREAAAAAERARRRASVERQLASSGADVSSGLSAIRDALRRGTVGNLRSTLEGQGAHPSAALDLASYVQSLIARGITSLATGGIVMPRAGGTVARIGEGGEAELVSPLSKLPQLLASIMPKNLNMGAGAGAFATRPMQQTIIVQLSERELTRSVAHGLPEFLRLEGAV